MSRIMFTIMHLLMVFMLAAQSKTTPVLSRDDYLNKSKKWKSTGYVLVTVGAAATIIGFVMSNTPDKDDDLLGLNSLEKIPGQMMVLVGVTTALCSIPFFINAAKYDRKAAALSFGNRKILSPFHPGFIATSQPTITLNIQF